MKKKVAPKKVTKPLELSKPATKSAKPHTIEVTQFSRSVPRATPRKTKEIAHEEPAPVATPPVESIEVNALKAIIDRAVREAIAEALPSLLAPILGQRVYVETEAAPPVASDIPKQLPGYPPDPRLENG